MHKTDKMLVLEGDRHQTLEILVPELIGRLGVSGAARELRISRSTLVLWVAKLGLVIRKQAVPRGEE